MRRLSTMLFRLSARFPLKRTKKNTERSGKKVVGKVKKGKKKLQSA